MTDDNAPVGEDDLLAFVDGYLTEARRLVVIRYLEANPAVKARINTDLAVRDWLRQRLAPIDDATIPDRLRVETILARRQETRRRRITAAAASVALLLAGGAGGWMANDLLRAHPTQRQQLALAAAASDAIAAHRIFVVETAHPVEVGAAQQQHLVQWLSRRLKHKLVAPDLSRQGYLLMGGRLLPAGSVAAAQFMYENGTGTRLTVYVRAVEGGDTQFRFLAADGLGAFSWVDEGLGFAIVGALDREQLLSLADSVYQQLDPQRRPPPGES
ncbi:MAG: anti-sigma factor [Acetobacteraceae bacterium]|nr:anti-sigma factor [Pseudomonadota bacterium]